jgi:hypothetical protein
MTHGDIYYVVMTIQQLNEDTFDIKPSLPFPTVFPDDFYYLPAFKTREEAQEWIGGSDLKMTAIMVSSDMLPVTEE